MPVIACTEFIPVYNEFFKFLDRREGRDAVVQFWRKLAEAYLGDLQDLAAAKGLRGCFEWWDRVLAEEAADYRLELDEADGEFRIVMHRCPSKGELLDLEHIEPYPDYCEHCDTLYRSVLEPLGFEYEFDRSECNRAACCRIVRKARAPRRRD
jgi:hypothetical protein